MKTAGFLWTLVALVAQLPVAVSAQTGAPAAKPGAAAKAELDASNRQAQQRYDADRLLCNDERDAKARLQCRRDARTEYDRALAEARVRLNSSPATVPGMGAAPAPAAAVPATTSASAAAALPARAVASPPKPACPDCGRVVSVTTTDKAGEGSAVGVIAGGATGALLGRQIGSGTGKDIATIAGALGGALAGKKIEEKVKIHKVWVVSVQYADGSTRSFEFEQDPGYKTGDAVKNSGQGIMRE